MLGDFLVLVSPLARTECQTRTALLPLRDVAEKHDVALYPVPRLSAGDGPPENRVENLERIGAQHLGLTGQPTVHVVGGQLTELAAAQRGNDVRIGKGRAFGNCALASTGHAELEPVADGLRDGVAVAVGDLTIFVIADDLA